jgi:isoamylase
MNTGGEWLRLVDTNLLEEDEDPDERPRFPIGHQYQVTGRSLLRFEFWPTKQPKKPAPG